MHSKVYKEYENIFREHNISGRVLEIGATLNKKSLLASKLLKNCDKTGINLVDSGKFLDFENILCNANDMSIFKDNEFDCVLCNSVLEHDKYFWKSISEMKRILKDNGILIIGTPSYKDLWSHKFTKYIKGQNLISDFLRSTTFTFKLHSYPGDYYRFSEETYKDVFFEGFKNVKIKTIMMPPRTIGYGFKNQQ